MWQSKAYLWNIYFWDVYSVFSVLKYAVFGSGPLTVLGGVEVGNNSLSQPMLLYVYERHGSFDWDVYIPHSPRASLGCPPSSPIKARIGQVWCFKAKFHELNNHLKMTTCPVPLWVVCRGLWSPIEKANSSYKAEKSPLQTLLMLPLLVGQISSQVFVTLVGI